MYACSGHVYHSRAGKGRRAVAKSRGIFAPNGKAVIRITVPATLTVHYCAMVLETGELAHGREASK